MLTADDPEENPAEPAGSSGKGATQRPRGVAGNSLITMFGKLFPPAAALISGPILAQSLGVTGRGEVAGAVAPMALVTALMSFGIPESLNYTVSRRPGLARAAMTWSTILLVVSGTCGMVAIYLARDWLSGGSQEMSQLMMIATWTVIPHLVLGVLRGAASGIQAWWLVARERILASGLRVAVLLVLFATNNLNVVTATIVLAMIPLMGSLAYVGLRRRIAATPQTQGPEARPRAILGYGVRIWLGSLSGIVLLRLDQTLMTPLAGPYQLGLYTVAVNIAEVPLIINSSIRDVIFSADARRSNDARLASAARVSTLATGSACLLIGATMWWWLPRLFGSEFNSSVQVAGVLLVATVVGTPGSIASAGLSARGRPGLRSLTLAIGATLNLVLVIALVPEHGAMGAAWASLVGYSTAAFLNLVFLRRISGIRIREFLGLRRTDLTSIRALVSSATRSGR